MNCTANACTTADAGDDAGRFALTTTAPCCRVTEYGLMRVSGKDAVTFLHGQFTNAVTGLADEVRNAGYCTPKGRLLATFRVWMDGDDVMMLVPKAVAPAFFKRLRMYVLRADVTFTCTGGDVVMTGVPAGAEAFLEAAGLPVPAPSRVVRHDGLVIVDAEPASKVEGFCAGGRRALIIAPKDDARFADASTDSALWWASEIAARPPSGRAHANSSCRRPSTTNFRAASSSTRAATPDRKSSPASSTSARRAAAPPSASWPAPRPRSPALPYTATAPKPAS